MKTFFYFLAVLLLALAAFFFFVPRKPPPLAAPSVTSSTLGAPAQANNSGEAASALPKVLTLYQKGEGESDLAAYVSRGLVAELKGRAVFQAVNTLDDPQVAEFYEVDSLPTIVFLLPSGQLFSKHEGYLEKEKVESVLQAMGRR